MLCKCGKEYLLSVVGYSLFVFIILVIVVEKVVVFVIFGLFWDFRLLGIGRGVGFLFFGDFRCYFVLGKNL